MILDCNRYVWLMRHYDCTLIRLVSSFRWIKLPFGYIWNAQMEQMEQNGYNHTLECFQVYILLIKQTNAHKHTHTRSHTSITIALLLFGLYCNNAHYNRADNMREVERYIYNRISISINRTDSLFLYLENIIDPIVNRMNIFMCCAVVCVCASVWHAFRSTDVWNVSKFW